MLKLLWKLAAEVRQPKGPECFRYPSSCKRQRPQVYPATSTLPSFVNCAEWHLIMVDYLLIKFHLTNATVYLFIVMFDIFLSYFLALNSLAPRSHSKSHRVISPGESRCSQSEQSSERVLLVLGLGHLRTIFLEEASRHFGAPGAVLHNTLECIHRPLLLGRCGAMKAAPSNLHLFQEGSLEWNLGHYLLEVLRIHSFLLLLSCVSWTGQNFIPGLPATWAWHADSQLFAFQHIAFLSNSARQTQ